VYHEARSVALLYSSEATNIVRTYGKSVDTLITIAKSKKADPPLTPPLRRHPSPGGRGAGVRDQYFCT